MIKVILFFILSSSAFGQVSFEQLASLKQALHKGFLELRPSESDILIINKEVPGLDLFWWNSESVHASYSKTEFTGRTEHHIFLFGGFARLERMTVDGLALTACHEIAHGIGGAPYKLSGSATEGQADYYAAKTCLPIVLKYLPNPIQMTENSYVLDLCKRESKNVKKCLRLFTAIESTIAFFETLSEYTRFSDYSIERPLQINSSDRFYPDTQCRLDTMIHGALKIGKPNCWDPNGINRRL